MTAHEILKCCVKISGANSLSEVVVPQHLFERFIYYMTYAVIVDEAYYREKYSDVNQAIIEGKFKDGKEHFRRSGFIENRLPRRILVDEHFYLNSNPDVKDAVLRGDISSAQFHYESIGYIEGRLPFKDFSLFADL
jgi:hypothetical protein